MKKGIHPEYKAAKITCVCGHVIETRSTKGDYDIQICANCHPFFTGKQKFVDTAGRVERFHRRYGGRGKAASVAEGPAPSAKPSPADGAAAGKKAAAAVAGKPSAGGEKPSDTPKP